MSSNDFNSYENKQQAKMNISMNKLDAGVLNQKLEEMNTETIHMKILQKNQMNRL